MEEILQGVIRESICDKLAKAPFDERLSVMSLLLAKLNDGFRQLGKMEERLERLQQLFGNVRPGSYSEQEYHSALERLEGILAGAQAEWKYKRESGLLGRQENRLYQDTGRILEETVQAAKAEHLQSPEEIWEKVQEIFGRENEAYEHQFEACQDRLEHGFDFMEAAFGDSQEMVVFVTGLNTGFYSVRFLQEYECQRYYQYNKRLLFDSQEREILSKINR